MADPILPRDLDAAPSVPSNASIIIDNGVTVQKATPAQVADTARPFSNQAEAEAGTDNAKTMTPLRTAQAIDARGYDGLIDGKEPVVDAGTTGQYYRGDKSWQALNKAAVGLGSADDTADADKPVSTAQQAALDDKTTAAAIGISGTATDMGPGGDILTDNADARTWFAELEDAIIETPGTAFNKSNAAAIGVDPTAVDMGTTPGTILSDNGTAKQWFQESEAAIEEISDASDATKGAAKVGFKAALTGAVGRTQRDKNQDTVSVKDFGAVADYVEFSDGAITSGTGDFTSATAGFAAADVGKSIVVAGAGAAGAGLVTTISAYVSATAVTLSTNASTTVSGANFGFGTDNYTAFTNTTSASDEVHLPRGSYYLGTGWVVAGGKSVHSRSGLLSSPARGTRLFFPPSVATCFSLGGPGSEGNGYSGSAKGFSVERAASTSATSGVGVNIERLYMAVVEDVKSKGSPKGFRIKADDIRGLGTTLLRCNTAFCTDVDIEIDTAAEVRAEMCRFGQNGSDANGNAYIRIRGGSTVNAAAGPNTINFVNCQFNKGTGGHVTNAIEFSNFTASYISDIRLFRFTSCHFEGYDKAVYTDSSLATLSRLAFSNTHFNSNVEFWSLDAGTTISTVSLDAGCTVEGSFTLNQTAAVTALNIGGRITGNLSLTSGNSNSSAIVSATVGGNMTLAGAWSRLTVSGNLTGTLTNTASGTWAVRLPGVDRRTWTPTILFAGGSTGITYSAQAGVVEVIGNEVIAQFNISLSSKGSSTGNAFIGGLPITIGGGANGASANGGGGYATYITSATGLTGSLTFRTPSGAQADIFQYGASGLARVTDANLTNTTTIAGTIRYFR